MREAVSISLEFSFVDFFFHHFNHRFHRNEMNLCVVWTIFLVFFTQNVCFCDDRTDPVTAGVVASTSATAAAAAATESTKSATPPKVYISPEKYRLPRTVLPELYKLNIFTHINDEEGFKFYGDVRIKVRTHTHSCLCLHFIFFIGLLTSFGAYIFIYYTIFSSILFMLIFNFAKNVNIEMRKKKNKEHKTKKKKCCAPINRLIKYRINF